jgi:hypothetical protein
MGRYNYTMALEKLTRWAEGEGYEVIFDHDDISYIEWYSETLNLPNNIKIENSQPIELKVYLLLHELGHHILRKDWGTFEEEFPIIAQAEQLHFYNNDIKYKRRVIYNVSCVEEEFRAWEEGYKLGKELDIRINYIKWCEFKSKYLLGYMRYYSNKKS